jgi:hypothetical protein
MYFGTVFMHFNINISLGLRQMSQGEKNVQPDQDAKFGISIHTSTLTDISEDYTGKCMDISQSSLGQESKPICNC